MGSAGGVKLEARGPDLACKDDEEVITGTFQWDSLLDSALTSKGGKAEVESTCFMKKSQDFLLS